MDVRVHVLIRVDLVVEGAFAFHGGLLNSIINQSEIHFKIGSHSLRTHIDIFIALILLQTADLNTADVCHILIGVPCENIFLSHILHYDGIGRRRHFGW